jgi:hypothetical protein
MSNRSMHVLLCMYTLKGSESNMNEMNIMGKRLLCYIGCAQPEDGQDLYIYRMAIFPAFSLWLILNESIV